MEPFSAAAAAVALCPIVIGIAKELRVAYKKITYARQELEELVNEMDIFTDLYTEFLKVCSTRKKHRRSVSSAKRKLVSWTKHAIADFKTLAHKVDALSRDPVYKHSIIDTGLAKFKWYFNTKHLVYLRASLSITRQSMVGFTNICAIELLDEQLAHLKSVLTAQQREDILYEYGMTVEQRIQVLQSSRDTYELKQSQLPNRLEEAEKKVNDYAKQKNKQDVIKQKRRVLDFSESVERHVERVLPMDDAGNRPPRPPRLHYYYYYYYSNTVYATFTPRILDTRISSNVP
ncbi:hypothetical protein J4E93_005591 [Alternaria ventricosa]|uniref:uncharacterized protein n=1 Tax=Alternaria ventricosa TaxID=1187951 RepID=UPI0020C48AF1|nr:uncharacterized protein J4E93_005591 [Alternaria ventricosa]KAI4646012.1 hypothetical protein J4E93_005591 [Alternaria ventricosa]